MMLTLRPARWPEDLAVLDGLDLAFTIDQIYRVGRDEHGFTLVEQRVEPPIRRAYESMASQEEELRDLPFTVVAEWDGAPAGFAAAAYEAWNRRAAIRHIHVAAEHRGRGVGRALMREIETFARSVGARCVWLDTQNTNVPAIRFYRRMGFRLCGLDDSFYDPGETAPGEVALFFARELTGTNDS